MLTLTVAKHEYFDDSLQEFVKEGGVTLEFEHSLATLSKWEAIHEKPFLSSEDKSHEEILSYIECMIVTPNFPPEVLSKLTDEDFEAINAYLNARQSATWFGYEPPSRKAPEIITAELIYYWMFSMQIPLECEHWHLNRLFTLVKVFNAKNGKEQKMSRSAAAEQRRALNEQRRRELNTRG